MLFCWLFLLLVVFEFQKSKFALFHPFPPLLWWCGKGKKSNRRNENRTAKKNELELERRNHFDIRFYEINSRDGAAWKRINRLHRASLSEFFRRDDYVFRRIWDITRWGWARAKNTIRWKFCRKTSRDGYPFRVWRVNEIGSIHHPPTAQQLALWCT